MMTNRDELPYSVYMDRTQINVNESNPLCIQVPTVITCSII